MIPRHFSPEPCTRRREPWAIRALLLVALLLLAVPALAQESDADRPGTLAPLPSVGSPGQPVAVGLIDEKAVAITGGQAFVLRPDPGNKERMQWGSLGATGFPAAPLALASSKDSLICVIAPADGSGQTPVVGLKLQDADTPLARTELPALPHALPSAAAAVVDNTVYVTDGVRVWTLALSEEGAAWSEGAPPPAALNGPQLVGLESDLYLFGEDAEADQSPRTYLLSTKSEVPAWKPRAAPPAWPAHNAADVYGYAHIYVFNAQDESGKIGVVGYHTITDRWFSLGELDESITGSPAVTSLGDRKVLLTPRGAALYKPADVQTNYGWLDHSVVALYLLGMLAMGWFFTRKRESSNDYFRGGQRIPWWAAGMSLFATGASAISLASMPGMAFGDNLTYFAITIVSAMCIPIAIFYIAPLVRRLNLSTANEYLERRFGVSSRLFASSIWIFMQVASRIASVMLVSAIALSSITQLEIWVAIVIMGVITTVYTYLGGLTAVIWTDTVQGFVMVITVSGCLILALVSLDTSGVDLWRELQAEDKLKMFDWDMTTVTRATTFVFFIHFLFFTCMYVTDQNFVQRVQSTPDLRQTKLAVATQMAVAVPINVLLFALGIVLWLFYRQQPASLTPTMENSDAVFPFFAAQQLPPGLSGLVVAALLAATMSTVSSGICSVSDLCTNDFYKRFANNPSDKQVLRLGRVLTAAIGVVGTVAAIILSGLDGVKSVWDTMVLVFSLISSGILGLFLLGFISRRTHELGALVGTATGMLFVVYLKLDTDVVFWLYIVFGTLVTVPVGLAVSLILPGQPRDTAGLTFYDLPQEAAGASTNGEASPAAHSDTP